MGRLRDKRRAALGADPSHDRIVHAEPVPAGAFQGRSPREAYFLKCDSETATQNDINLGVVNILVGFAPLKSAEFVIIRIERMAGQVHA